MKLSKPDPLMHYLPTHRGEEVVDSVINGVYFVVFDEIENHLHTQKVILSWCLHDPFFSAQ